MMIQITKRKTLDLGKVRSRLAGKQGAQFWRSLEEVAETDEFKEYIHREFPSQASELNDPVTRRTFLKVMGASLALAGVAGCSPRQPDEKIYPYARKPDNLVYGEPMFFATAMPLAGYAMGLLVESHMGRPIKVEGNPQHPASLGATDAIAQASVLGVYDPDRSQGVLAMGRPSVWDNFLAFVQRERDARRANGGAGFRVLTENITSPTLLTQLNALRTQFPNVRVHRWEPTATDGARAGAQAVFGAGQEPVFHFDRADVILSLDSDFMGTNPAHVRYARDFISRRKVAEGQAGMNRLYVVEPTPSITGATADHRLPLGAGRVELFARAVAQAVGVGAAQGTGLTDEQARWAQVVARDLQAHRGACVVVPGEYQSAAVHALAHAMNQALGAVGTTVTLQPAVDPTPEPFTDSLRALVDDMNAGAVDLLLILGGNPVYSAPADFDFLGALEKVKTRIHLGHYVDETAAYCHWHVPEAHYLEAWGDVRAFDGTVTIMQPLIAPMYGGRSAIEVLAAFVGQPGRAPYEIVREYWTGQGIGDDFEAGWQQALNDGVVPTPAAGAAGAGGSAQPAQAAAPGAGPAAAPTQPQAPGTTPAPAGAPPAGAAPAAAAAQAIFAQAPPAPGEGLEIVLRPDPMLWDGRFANNGWLQEVPKPLTKLSWDNAALVGIGTAQRLGVNNGDVVDLRVQGRSVPAPVWILPGQAENSVTLYLGHGRQRAGRVGNGVGRNAYLIRTSGSLWHAAGLEVAKTGTTYPLATTELHNMIDNQTVDGEHDRHLVRVGSLEQFRADPNFAHRVGHQMSAEGETHETTQPTHPSLMPEYPYDGNKWGMVIDLSSCIGCNACVVACQAENNIPVVGREQVATGREMYWLRIDRYFEGQAENPHTYFEPIPCMHCEQAPCEIVCPVAATVHDTEGLNTMVYNRCIGTRYCSNNCPYKVRHFNFLHYGDDSPLGQLRANPDVTIRWRGVMEKCTYCVQRIWHARTESEKQNRPIRDGEIQTACQQVCPTDTIVFGNLNDPNSRVARLHKSPLNYGLLTELNTQPRTTYLARVRNPNRELEPAEVAHPSEHGAE
jgi:molybdopterin-containing oxidoreductase family iron-sulfur binding subunit